MPAYTTHTLFAHLAMLALVESGHPLAGVARRHAGMLRVAGIAGCDIQCMPYQVCGHCRAPYRHNQRDSRMCLVCRQPALEDFSFTTSDGRRFTRVDIERDLYRHTHLVLGRRPRPYGVAPGVPPGPPEQPFPPQVVQHLANVLRDAAKVVRDDAELSRYYAFTLGWFAHVVSDALFKGVYPHSTRVRFFGHQYHMAMLPAAETLTMTDIAHDFGVHWPAWHAELLKDERNPGALRHLAMASPPELYDRAYWKTEFGEPDPENAPVFDALWLINRTWFHAMYLTPDYTAPSPALDERKLPERASWVFNQLDLGRVRAHAIRSGWYQTFVTGVDIYLRIVGEATRVAGIAAPPPAQPAHPTAVERQVNYTRWRDVIDEAMRAPEPEGDWGSRLRVDAGARDGLARLARDGATITLANAATDYQSRLAEALQRRWGFGGRSGAHVRGEVIIGSPMFVARAADFLCPEDALRLKYRDGLAGLISYHPAEHVLHFAGFSDFGDAKMIGWLEAQDSAR